MSVTVNIVLLGLFSVMAFWRPNPILFMVAAGIAMMFGLGAPDAISGSATTTGTDIAVGLMLIAYSFFCIGMAFRMLFFSRGTEANELSND